MSAPPTGSPATPRRKRRLATAMIAAGTTLATAALALLPAGTASASSHREAPLISTMPLVDNTDVYSFVSPDKPDTVTLIADWFGFQEPNGGPNFYQWAENAHYDINIDSDGDGKADTTYRWDFTTDDRRIPAKTFLYDNGPVTSLDDPNLLFRQFYTLTVIKNGKPKVLIKNAQVAPSNTGPASVPDYGKLRAEATRQLPGGGQTVVAQSDEPFFLDLRIFDLIFGGNLSEVGQDTFAGYNVDTIAIQVPIKDVALNGNGKANPVIGVYSTTEMRSLALQPTGGAKPTGDYVQVSRLGNPLVNELVIDVSLKDAFNAITPDKDATIPAVVARITDPEVPKLIQAIYGIPAPATPRNDLVEIFLTGIAKKAPTLDGSAPPIQADLNSQVLNADVDPAKFQPSEMQRLNTAVPPTAKPNRLGVLGGDLQGFPNGRRLADDVVDIEIQALEGAVAKGLPVKLVPALAGGDAVNTNDKKFGDTFPYVALPNNKNVNDPANTQPDIPAGNAVAPGAPGAGPSLPTASLVSGLAAVVLLGAGGVLFTRRRKETASAAA